MPHVSVCVGMDRWVVEGACIPRNYKNKMLRVPGEKHPQKKRAMPFLHLPSASDAPLCTCRRRRLTSVAPGAPGLTLTVECKLVEEGAPPAGGDGGQRHRRCGGGVRGTNPPTNGLPYGPSHLWLRCGSFASFCGNKNRDGIEWKQMHFFAEIFLDLRRNLHHTWSQVVRCFITPESCHHTESCHVDVMATPTFSQN